MFAITKTDHTQPSTMDAKIHSGWDEILAKALAKDREHRYASAREMVEAVRDAPGH
jgi:hypothetical protein